MKQSHIVFVLNDTVRAVKGRYEDSGSETIFKTMDPTIAVDDFAVVESGTRWKMTTVKISAVDVDVDLDNGPEVPWLIQKVDMPAFSRLLAQEAEAIAAVQAAEKKRKRDELRAAMMANHEAEIARLPIADMGAKVIE